MSNVKQYKPDQTKHEIRMTTNAIAHVRRLIQKRGKGIGIRFCLKKSGCSGYRYDVEIIDQFDEAKEIKFTIETNLIVVVPKNYFPMLQGTTIDYIKKELNSEMVFDNPNQSAECGCGESVAIDIPPQPQ